MIRRMDSPTEKHRVSVIHARPSVICPPRTEAPALTYHNLQNGQKRPVTSPLAYDDFEMNAGQEFTSPYPPSLNYQSSSNCSENSTGSFLEWPEIPSPTGYDKEPAMLKVLTAPSSLPSHQMETPSPPVPSRNEAKFQAQNGQFEPSRVQASKRSRKSSSKSDPFAYPPDENSFPEAVTTKKIKLEGAAGLKEKVGNKPISNCRVCGDLAVAHMHYGGVCCYSCKAFFRRATQTGKDKKYKCKSDQQCVITYTNRRSCQYCRFSKCLAVGMRPNWVLSDEQCSIRFRNVRKEQGNKAREGTAGAVVIKEETVEVDKGLLMPFTGEESKSLELLVDCYTLSKETYTFSEENDRLWSKLFKQDSSQDQSSSSGQKYDYSTFDLGSLIMTVIKKNIFFVKMNDKFNELTSNDQKLILQKNMSEMVHIRGAIRFDSKSKNFVWYFSKKDQMQMAFEKKNSDGSSSSSGAKHTRLSNALIGQQDMSKFYKSTTSQNIFSLVNKLCEIGLPMEVFLVMTNIVLFSSDGLKLEKPEMACAAQTYFMFFLHRYLNELFGRDDARMKLSRIMGILVELRELCERSKEEELVRINLTR